MTNEGPASNVVTWSVPQCPFTIECLPRVLDEIRLSVIDAFFSLPRGGAEIGGVLLGRYSAGRLLVSGYRPLECEHAFGPSFTLSERDFARLRELLASAESEPGDSRPVGWYHSHTRSEIFLSDVDCEIHDRFFAQPWQVALVLKPHTFQPTRAGFFFRESGGQIYAEKSYQEIVLNALPIAPAQQPSDRGRPAAGPDTWDQPGEEPRPPRGGTGPAPRGPSPPPTADIPRRPASPPPIEAEPAPPFATGPFDTAGAPPLPKDPPAAGSSRFAPPPAKAPSIAEMPRGEKEPPSTTALRTGATPPPMERKSPAPPPAVPPPAAVAPPAPVPPPIPAPPAERKSPTIAKGPFAGSAPPVAVPPPVEKKSPAVLPPLPREPLPGPAPPAAAAPPEKKSPAVLPPLPREPLPAPASPSAAAPPEKKSPAVLPPLPKEPFPAPAPPAPAPPAVEKEPPVIALPHRAAVAPLLVPKERPAARSGLSAQAEKEPAPNVPFIIDGPSSATKQPPDSELPRFLAVETPKPRRRWPGLGLWIGLAVLAVSGYVTRGLWWEGLQSLLAGAHAAPLGLHALDANGQLQIQWDAQSPALRRPKGARLTILDGTKLRAVPLDLAQLSSGAYTYMRQGEKVDVTLAITESNGQLVREQTGFLGSPAVVLDNQAVRQRDDLEGVTQQLKSDLQKERDHAKKLEKENHYLRDQLERELRLKRLEKQMTPEKQ